MIQNPIFGVYLLISYFLTESLKGIKNYQQRSLILQYSFAQKKTSFILQTSTYSTLKKYILPQHSQKPYSLYKFSSKTVTGLCQKKNCAAPFLDTQLLPAGALNNFLKAARCLSLVQSFKIFHFK